jgi:hypothetical protein
LPTSYQTRPRASSETPFKDFDRNAESHVKLEPKDDVKHGCNGDIGVMTHQQAHPSETAQDPLVAYASATDDESKVNPEPPAARTCSSKLTSS